jgi:hypothetical protein
MTHHSKVDVYILAAILLAIGVFLLGDYWIAGPILLILLLSAYPQSYVTTPRGLVIRAALTKVVIPYETISSIGPAEGDEDRSIFSFSADRIRIQYGPASDILIAPANPHAFFADMAKRTPHLMKRGQRLTAAFA